LQFLRTSKIKVPLQPCSIRKENHKGAELSHPRRWEETYRGNLIDRRKDLEGGAILWRVGGKKTQDRTKTAVKVINSSITSPKLVKNVGRDGERSRSVKGGMNTEIPAVTGLEKIEDKEVGPLAKKLRRSSIAKSARGERNQTPRKHKTANRRDWGGKKK